MLILLMAGGGGPLWSILNTKRSRKSFRCRLRTVLRILFPRRRLRKPGCEKAMALRKQKKQKNYLENSVCKSYSVPNNDLISVAFVCPRKNYNTIFPLASHLGLIMGLMMWHENQQIGDLIKLSPLGWLCSMWMTNDQDERALKSNNSPLFSHRHLTSSAEIQTRKCENARGPKFGGMHFWRLFN